jgi:hypothetical protein
VSRANVELHIEELILHGFPPGDRHAMAAALESELGRLLDTHGLPRAFPGNTSIDSLDAGSFQTGHDVAPRDVGTDIARSVYGGFEQ